MCSAVVSKHMGMVFFPLKAHLESIVACPIKSSLGTHRGKMSSWQADLNECVCVCEGGPSERG